LVKVCDRVAAESHLTCGGCFQCRTCQAHVCKNYRILGIDFDGAYAEFVSLPERVLWKTAPEIPPELGCLHEPLGNAVDAAIAEPVVDSPSVNDNMEVRIAERAYELHHHRGGHHGQDLDDWLTAEREVLSEESC